MVITNPTTEQDGKGSGGLLERAVTEATDGLKEIRDEGPSAEPVYPTHASAEAHEAWAFDSASYERAQTAQDALDRVAEIMSGQVHPS
ncbi:hypothetical protein E4V01_20485 [Methylorubrum sp. Q1]|uniref:hypothetical protein n=1 Tax=Methylorubrum sp. Q1 TaxID=2562453 RepID=UPI0010769D71|nr:hypothetical protein [Methylorubrum sp. Q1]TFZ55898.1 hypothetical protein E4V01_20485 [Methylorubrum sp. Q1]